MIYLIDDKKNRQNEFGWNDDVFKEYVDIIRPIYSLDELELMSQMVFQEDNVILYHESFLDNTSKKTDALVKRQKLVKFAEENENFHVAIFSGSMSTRSLDDNIAHLPVSSVFKNLKVLIHQARQGTIDLKYLLFGTKPEIEEELLSMLTAANSGIDEAPAKANQKKTLFIRPNIGFIQNAIEGAEVEALFNDVSDEKLSQKVIEWLSKEEFDNIFVPICFGSVLSDFNGLRLATHIRCTNTPNRLTNIFIYSFVGIDYLFDDECFNILKTKNIRLIDHKKKAIQVAVTTPLEPLYIRDLPKELAKLKLDSPKNYEDSHSISNEWAIYQWAKTIGADENEELHKVFTTADSSLYFKYLRTVYPVSEISPFKKKQLQIEHDSARAPKVLLIDDESEKGWYEIFAYLLGDVNDISTDYLAEDFKKLTQQETINKSLKKINEEDIDIVILDFRLNPDDFATQKIDDISSYNLLSEIKKINPGIQVIIFSATNKVWNLQALQVAGADGFILKESPKNSVDSEFTSNSIRAFIKTFQEATRRLFLKDFYKLLFQAKENLRACNYVDDTDFEDFLKDLKSHIKLIAQSGRQVDPNTSITFDVVFLNCFNFIEKFKHYYLKEQDHRFYLGIEEVPLLRYEYTKGSINVKKGEGEFVRYSRYDKPSWFQCISGLLVDYFKAIDTRDPTIRSLWQVKSMRNDYIHNTKSSFDSFEILIIMHLIAKITSSMKE
jgi:CheY-like chemotaxis protein